jgi:hypothetical protein
MKRSRFSEEQIIGVLKEAEAGVPAKHNFHIHLQRNRWPRRSVSIPYAADCFPVSRHRGASREALRNHLGT